MIPEVVKGCPKMLKNGPCGGYHDGMCEVYPDKKCLFVAAWRTNPEVLRRMVG